MPSKKSTITQKDIDQLYAVILSLRGLSEIRKFFRDLLTETEITEMTERWKVATMLSEGVPYSRIIEQTGLSSTTVARVAGWLKEGAGGYRLALRRARQGTPQGAESPKFSEDPASQRRLPS